MKIMFLTGRVDVEERSLDFLLGAARPFVFFWRERGCLFFSIDETRFD